MSDYTQVSAVAAMWPTWNKSRGSPQQAPLDTDVGTWIADLTGRINAILLRRFSESISTIPYSGNLVAWVAALPGPATALLEQVERYGAAAQLGYVLASIGGSAGILRNAERIQKDFDKLWNDLNATNDKGESLEAGPYDKYFDPLSKIESPRPLLSATSGADQPANQTSQTLGQTALFSIHQVI